MHPIPILDPLALIAIVGVIVSVVLSRARLPTAAGLLAAGGLLGPHGFALVPDVALIEILAEVGVILLLFTVGLEFPVSTLKRVAKHALLGGLLQVGLTTAAAALLARLLGLTWPKAIFYGLVLSQSSTAIVLRTLTDRNELDAPHGRFVVGVLLFQDLAVVPMILLVPALAGNAGAGLVPVAVAVLKAVAVVAVTLSVAGFGAPRAFGWVAGTRSREVFVLGVVALCIGAAWATGRAGLSTALGAFLAGVVLAGTEFRHRAMSDVLPLRDVFASVFFVSLGMLFDSRVAVEDPAALATLVAAFFGIKGLTATLAALAMRFPARVARLAGAALAQFGEFGFVLVGLGLAANIVEPHEVRRFVAAGVITMFLSPIVARIAPHVTAGERLLRPLERVLGAKGADEAEVEKPELAHHVVLFGFGVTGRLVARALEGLSVPYVIVEINADTVSSAQRAGVPAYYGDATSAEVLHHVAIERARAVVLAINDADAARRALPVIRSVNKEVPVVVRTRFLAEVQRLQALGATEVVADEAFAGVEMVSRALGLAGASADEIHRAVGAAVSSVGDVASSLPKRS
ncbi:MAG: cation:proton antiporter [Deltaproteobacteria bacterium]|nr:cation:proton antiporter [Deltaproteobacteria bacterium]